MRNSKYSDAKLIHAIWTYDWYNVFFETVYHHKQCIIFFHSFFQDLIKRPLHLMFVWNTLYSKLFFLIIPYALAYHNTCLLFSSGRPSLCSLFPALCLLAVRNWSAAIAFYQFFLSLKPASLQDIFLLPNNLRL